MKNRHMVLCALMLACSAAMCQPVTESYMAKVISVTDGDTITVLRGNEQIKIRLHGIDAPESYQAFGTKSKQYASELSFWQHVTIMVTDQDRYGRTVANVLLPDGRILNHEMVAAGLAWWYRQYAKQDTVLADLQARAQAAKAGLWSDPHALPPWEFRRDPTKTASPSPQPTTKQIPYTQTQTPNSTPTPQAAPLSRPNPPSQEAPASTTVYVTKTGKMYHTEHCRSLSKSKIPMPLEKARKTYQPCSVCRPPQ